MMKTQVKFSSHEKQSVPNKFLQLSQIIICRRIITGLPAVL